MIYFIVFIISGTIGFTVCALLTASKIADLNDEISGLRWVNQDLLDENIKLHHTVFLKVGRNDET